MKGRFKPKNPQKYKGNPTEIIWRSSWEQKLMSYLDSHPDVVWWSSEELIVPYRSPADGRVHRYFPDFVFKNKKGEVIMVEIKPNYQRNPPVLAEGKKITKTYKRAVVTYAINQAKWSAASAYCEDRGWKFRIMDEYDLGISNKKTKPT